MNEEHGSFTYQIKAVLDRSSTDLDADTAARLARARRAAIDPLSYEPRLQPTRRALLARARVQVEPTSGRRHRHLATGGLAVAASLLLAAGLWMSPPMPDAAPPDLEDLPLLAEKPDLDFYQEMDFYVWLTEQDDEG